MGLRILYDPADDMAAMYDSVTDWAFGPVFYGPDAMDRIGAFIHWLADDARTYPSPELERLYSEWCDLEAAGETAESDA
jgi:hypothetical protein